MAVTNLQVLDIIEVMEAFLERKRPPAHIRSKLDIGYKIEGLFRLWANSEWILTFRSGAHSAFRWADRSLKYLWAWTGNASLECRFVTNVHLLSAHL